MCSDSPGLRKRDLDLTFEPQSHPTNIWRAWAPRKAYFRLDKLMASQEKNEMDSILNRKLKLFEKGNENKIHYNEKF